MMRKSTFILKKIMISLLALIIASTLFIPVNVHAAPDDPRFLSTSSQLYTSLALDRDGQIWAWGLNDQGGYGNGTTVASLTPKKIEVMDSGSPMTFKKVKAGFGNSAALDAADHLWITGSDEHERLGNESAGSSLFWEKRLVSDAGTDVKFTDMATRC
jgi:alpha-tubulin suppressor-like RCC1 family protein